MHKTVAFIASVVLVFVVPRATALCCGSGKHGYCNDCTKVGAGKCYSRHCCYHGTTYAASCNIFCCNCKTCIAGHPIITFASGFWPHNKKYTCKLHSSDTEIRSNQDDLTDTQDKFDGFDKSGDGVIDQDEFLDALKSHLGASGGDMMASNLLRSDDLEEAANFAEAVNDDAMDEEDNRNLVRMAAREFLDMDRNSDGFIQANEFDSHLAEDFA